jgi:fructan beta-fructosidase
MTLPRTLELIKTETSFRLKSRLPVNWETFVSKRELLKETKVNESNTIVAAQSIDLSSAKLNMKLKNLEKSTYTFVLSNQSGDSLTFGYAHEERQFFIDRSKLKHAEFSKDFSNKKSVAPRFQLQDELPVELVLDKASMELFYDRGETVMTEIFFPENPFESLTLITEKPGKTRIEVEVLELNIEK